MKTQAFINYEPRQNAMIANISNELDTFQSMLSIVGVGWHVRAVHTRTQRYTKKILEQTKVFGGCSPRAVED